MGVLTLLFSLCSNCLGIEENCSTGFDLVETWSPCLDLEVPCLLFALLALLPAWLGGCLSLVRNLDTAEELFRFLCVMLASTKRGIDRISSRIEDTRSFL